MKILRVAADLYPSVVGGVGIHVHEMSKEQVALGHEVTVYTTNVDSSPKEEMIEGYNILRFKSLFKLCGNAFSPTMFFKLIKHRHDYDIIHAHSHLFFTTNLCSIVKILDKSVPLVITSHGLIPASGPDWLHKIYIPTIGKFVLNSADLVICYTDKEKIRLKNEVGVKSKITVIHNGIDTNLFRPITDKKTTNQLLWIGRFTRGKGLDYLIDAFGILAKKYPKLKLILVGEGPEKQNIMTKVVHCNLQNKVIFQDYCPNSELCAIYNRSDIYILPSFEEGVPRTIMESMACGIPVICTELPHLLEMIKDVGITVPVKDSNAIVDAVSQIYNNPETAEELRGNGRSKAIKQYSWDDTVFETIEEYKNMLR
ncbi:glycosyltransferase family 4 protein [Methanolobus bombayensis]|uniref:glycosyltransferase family 4 protein n=1 Tax=Methanolobus bombayensis TaxID=38023 RepID=UPI001AE991BA|nr:glycosyltransferase involved in cell wall biosynthesis [Methanolobus bombayensis]